LWGISSGFFIILIAFIFAGCVDFFKPGSTAYLMTTFPKELSSTAIAIFRIGVIFGVVTYIVFGFLLQWYDFVTTVQLACIGAGIILLISACIRQALLDPCPTEKQTSLKQVSTRHLLTAMASVTLIVMVDGVSDALFRFVSAIYTNEALGISVGGINIIYIASLVASIPITLRLGRSIDRKGDVKSKCLKIYALMPFCSLFLIIAAWVPYWGPIELVQMLDGVMSGLGAILSFPSLALILKTLNDLLWSSLLLIIIYRSIPDGSTSEAFGLVSGCGALMGAVTPLLGAFIFETYAPMYVFVLVLVLNLCILLVLSRMKLNITTDNIQRPSIALQSQETILHTEDEGLTRA
jgi:hypothetical protein